MVARFVSQDHVVLGQRRRQRLEAMVRRGTAQVREVTRARIVLAAADRVPTRRSPPGSGCTSTRSAGCAAGSSSRECRRCPTGPDRAGRFSTVRMPGCWWWRPRRAFHRGRRRSGPHTAIAGHLQQEHRIPISASQVGRILGELDVKPHLDRGWLNRPPDPAFFAKAKEICELYLNPPPDAVLLSIDEKTGIQAKSRKYPSIAVAPGWATRR